MRKSLWLTGAVFLGSLAAPCQAGVIFTSGNIAQPNEQNVLFNGGGVAGGSTGASVFGTTNPSSLQVKFTSAGAQADTLNEPSNGQARITASDGAINNITISLPGKTFTGLIINPRGSGLLSLTANGNVSGGLVDHQTFINLGNGENFVTITSILGETLNSVTLSSVGGFDDLRQVRISGFAAPGGTPGGNPGGTPGANPEPTSIALLSIGLATMAGYSWRRRR